MGAVCFTPLPFNLRTIQRYCIKGLGGPQGQYGRCGQDKNLWPPPEIEPRPSSKKPSRYIGWVMIAGIRGTKWDTLVRWNLPHLPTSVRHAVLRRFMPYWIMGHNCLLSKWLSNLSTYTPHTPSQRQYTWTTWQEAFNVVLKKYISGMRKRSFLRHYTTKPESRGFDSH
jgi:hypothetical protein